MNPDHLGTSPSYEDKYPGKESLIALTQSEIQYWKDFIDSLEITYERDAFEDFENRLFKTGTTFNRLLRRRFNEDYEYIQSSEYRQKFLQEIVTNADEAGHLFQQANQSESFNRSSCKRAVENLLFSLQNFLDQISNQSTS